MSAPSRFGDAFNIPNTITWIRLAMSVVVFVLLAWSQYLAAFILFTIAVSTDWLDGYLARLLKQTTQLGRILDPWVDKVIVSGTFIYLAAVPDTGIIPAVALIVVARELLVTALRSHLEAQRIDFSASWQGKVKMVLQSAALIASLAMLADGGMYLPDWTVWLRDTLIWSAVISTILSGLDYVFAAIRGGKGS